MEQDDISNMIRDYRHHLDILVEEKHAREREARKQMQHDNRVDFRAGVLNMLLEGRVNFKAG